MGRYDINNKEVEVTTYLDDFVDITGVVYPRHVETHGLTSGPYEVIMPYVEDLVVEFRGVDITETFSKQELAAFEELLMEEAASSGREENYDE